jgi:glycosyltransferase involved in cell wall biosynthesis
VLTGTGADLPGSKSALKRTLRRVLEPMAIVRPTRATALRRQARRWRLRFGEALVPVGYVTDPEYYTLLRRAWVLVMPTFAEGGGSFPVEEAMRYGVPVVCSDIAVMREHVARVGGEVLWFDPRDPRDLAARLTDLETNYAAIKARSVAQVGALQHRTWDHVASEYWPMLTAAAELMATR